MMYDILYQKIELLASGYEPQIKNPAIQMAKVAGKLRVISLWIRIKGNFKTLNSDDIISQEINLSSTFLIN